MACQGTGQGANLKKYRGVKASLEGIHAVSSGMVIAATFLLFEPIDQSPVNYILVLGTMCLLFFTRIPMPLIVLAGLVMGIVVN